MNRKKSGRSRGTTLCGVQDAFTIHAAPVREIDPVTLYRLLALRVDIFVVEQNCPYRELDGRDLETDAVQVWAQAVDGDPIATLRLLRDPDGSARIGRVATAASARSAGIAARLMERALELAHGRAVVLDAQVQLEGWYARFGFTRAGPNFDEDDIAHLPMHRPGA
jgi:ElaA protein